MALQIPNFPYPQLNTSQPDPFEYATKSATLQNLVNNGQLQQQALQRDQFDLQQQQQKTQRDQQIQQAVQAHLAKGGKADDAELLNQILGVSLPAGASYAETQQKISDQQTQRLINKQALQDKQTRDLQTAAQSVLEADPKAQPTAYQWFRSAMVKKGLVGPDDLPQDYDAGIMTQLAGPQKSEIVPAGASVVRGGNPIYTAPEKKSVEEKEMDSWLTANPGKTPADFMAYKQTLKPPDDQAKELDDFLKEQSRNPKFQKYPPNRVGLAQWKADMIQQRTINNFNIEQATREADKKGNDPRLMDVEPSMHKDVLDKYQKTSDTYNGVLSAKDDIDAVLRLAKSGNKEAQANASLLGVASINRLNGIKRINSAEIEQYGSAGSLIDNLTGKLGKIVAGQPIPPDVLNDMQKLHDALASNAGGAFVRSVDSLNRTYHSQFDRTLPGSISVTDPRGVVHTFPTQQQADAFKKAAGLQ